MTAESAQFGIRAETNNDFDLVQASKNGDVAAFEQLVKRYDGKPFRIAQSVTHNREDSQDAVQEAFLKAPTLGRFQGRFPILDLADSHHSEPIADEAAKATQNKRGVLE